ncbi:hypothetical protein CCHR01_00980 [Colletotrichum chrysophilum]|uniref:Uncharacterized protein n=1 Tax=Colletotrichum chrysophilum TaxID=1836956 RepID=A0AAD9ELP1_9PEZI|nr:hypothetical protein CCHR01_00980 [Colletotrichum chrysophilum]
MRFLLLVVLAALSASTPAPSGPYHIAGDGDMSNASQTRLSTDFGPVTYPQVQSTPGIKKFWALQHFDR